MSIKSDPTTPITVALDELIKILVEKKYLDDKDIQRIRRRSSWFI